MQAWGQMCKFRISGPSTLKGRVFFERKIDMATMQPLPVYQIMMSSTEQAVTAEDFLNRLMQNAEFEPIRDFYRGSLTNCNTLVKNLLEQDAFELYHPDRTLACHTTGVYDMDKK